MLIKVVCLSWQRGAVLKCIASILFIQIYLGKNNLNCNRYKSGPWFEGRKEEGKRGENFEGIKNKCVGKEKAKAKPKEEGMALCFCLLIIY